MREAGPRDAGSKGCAEAESPRPAMSGIARRTFLSLPARGGEGGGRGWAVPDGRDTASSLRPAIEGERACLGHGVCVSVCPTGALRIRDLGMWRGLIVESSACTGCGRCETVCPERALGLRRDAPRAGTIVLALNPFRRCRKCEAEFTETADTELCPACRKELVYLSALAESRAGRARRDSQVL